MTCECKQPGECPRWKRKMSPREWQVCNGVNCTPELQERYAVQWSRGVDQRPAPTPSIQERIAGRPGFDPCIHLGRAVRDDNGQPKKKWCKGGG